MQVSWIRVPFDHSVPDPPTGVSFLVFGTADVQISWTMPNSLSLRGDNQLFFVKIFNNGTLRGELQVNETSILLNASVGVVNGCTQDIEVS